MAHYAFIDENNIVTEVIAGVDENVLIDGFTPEDYYASFKGATCIRTSYNHRIRKQYAGIGFTYDPVADVFVAPQPYLSWTLDSNHDWQPPKAKPEGEVYWSEEEGEWLAYEEEPVA